MSAKRKFVCLLLSLPLLYSAGCSKKKLSLPPQLPAPTVAVVLPDEIPLSNEPGPEVAPPPAVTPTEPPPKTKPKKPSRGSSSSAKKNASPTNPSQSTPPASNNTQTVAGLHTPKSSTDAAPSSALVAAVPSAQVAQQKEDTLKMVDATENALKGLNRTLTDDEKSIRSQIQSFLQQSRKATTDGDYERAFLLAKKAQLLADALVKK